MKRLERLSIEVSLLIIIMGLFFYPSMELNRLIYDSLESIVGLEKYGRFITAFLNELRFLIWLPYIFGSIMVAFSFYIVRDKVR